MNQIDKDILTILMIKGGELYGLEILDNLEITFDLASIYPALGRLEKEGFVSWSWRYKDYESARRKCYEITDLGLATINRILD